MWLCSAARVFKKYSMQEFWNSPGTRGGCKHSLNQESQAQRRWGPLVHLEGQKITAMVKLHYY